MFSFFFVRRVIQVLLDHEEEDAMNVGRLDQLANCADGLRARVELNMLSCSTFSCECALLEDGGAGNDWVARFFILVKNPDEDSVTWPEACCVVAELLGALGIDVVVLVPLAIPPHTLSSLCS